jgi:hypothetical protein
MDCEKCGASVPENADTCPECGEPVASEIDLDWEDTPAAAASVDAADQAPDPAPDEVADAAPEEDAPEEPSEKPGMPGWMGALILLLIVVLIGAGGYFGWQYIQNQTNNPSAVVTRMLDAYAKYDAQGILDNSTQGSFVTSDTAAFTQQAEAAKTSAGGKPGVKDVKILTVTIDPKNPDAATVQISGSWLDSTSGAYTPSTQTINVVRENGRWLVKLF